MYIYISIKLLLLSFCICQLASLSLSLCVSFLLIFFELLESNERNAMSVGVWEVESQVCFSGLQ